MLNGLKSEIKKRFTNKSKIYDLFEQKLQELSEDWMDKIKNHELKNYEKIDTKFKKEIGLLFKPSDEKSEENENWKVMQSMREIDTNSFITKDQIMAKYTELQTRKLISSYGGVGSIEGFPVFRTV